MAFILITIHSIRRLCALKIVVNFIFSTLEYKTVISAGVATVLISMEELPTAFWNVPVMQLSFAEVNIQIMSMK
jgi:hypothetical protein